MKKMIFMALAAIFMVAANAKADSKPSADSEVSFEITLSLREMNKAMHLDINQFEVLDQTNRSLTRRVGHLASLNPERRREMLQQFLGDNLSTVRVYLNNDQYRAYLEILNREFNECGLTSILYGMDVAQVEEPAESSDK